MDARQGHRGSVHSLVEGGALAAFSIIFAFVAIYLPVVGAFVSLVWAAPIALLVIRYGVKWSLLAALATGLVIMLPAGPTVALMTVINFSLAGITLGYAFAHNWSLRKLLLGTITAAFVSLGISWAVNLYMLGIHVTDVFTVPAASVIVRYRNLGMPEEMLAVLQKAIDMILLLVPSVVVLVAVLTAYVNYFITRRVLLWFGQQTIAFPPVKTWRIPRTVWYFLAVAIVLTVAGQWQSVQLLSRIGWNAVMLGLFAFAIQGIAVLCFYIEKFNGGNVVKGFLLVMLLLLYPIAVPVLGVLGFADAVLDMRSCKPRSLDV